jgi:hypothetical protein
MSWGVFPLLFVANGVSLEGVGLIKAVYPVVRKTADGRLPLPLSEFWRTTGEKLDELLTCQL